MRIAYCVLRIAYCVFLFFRLTVHATRKTVLALHVINKVLDGEHLLSNGNSYPERCGLEGMFQFVIFSQDYGVEKPNPRLFKIAVEKAGCSKQQLLHVGDSLQNDVMGAVSAGIKCVWLNRQNMKNNLRLKIDYEVSSLLELLESLTEIMINRGEANA